VIQHLEHVGLSVSDLERSIDFYCKNLNLKVVRILEPSEGLPMDELTGLRGCQVRIAHLSSDVAMLELFEYVEPKGVPIRPDAKQADIGRIVRTEMSGKSGTGITFSLRLPRFVASREMRRC
jgi:catechol 2,3-dioxygenase-like lactoylglutathione lyase family enzyme